MFRYPWVHPGCLIPGWGIQPPALPPMGGGQPEPSLPDLADRLQAVQEALAGLQGALQSLEQRIQSAPPKLQAERLVVRRLEFNFDQIKINHLSGEFNLGVTNKLQVGGGSAPPTRLPAQPPDRPGRKARVIWPKPKEEKPDDQPPRAPTQPARAGSPDPPVDIRRAAHDLVVTAALPGLLAGDFRISLVGNRQLHIEGNVPYRHPVPHHTLALAERRYGPFARTLTLPLPVDAGSARVHFERGVLTVRLRQAQPPLRLQWEPAGEVAYGNPL